MPERFVIEESYSIRRLSAICDIHLPGLSSNSAAVTVRGKYPKSMAGSAKYTR